MSKTKLTIGQITKIIAKYETLSSFRASDGDYLCEKYMQTLEGEEKKVLQLYIEAKFKQTLEMYKPLFPIKTPEA